MSEPESGPPGPLDLGPPKSVPPGPPYLGPVESGPSGPPDLGPVESGPPGPPDLGPQELGPPGPPEESLLPSSFSSSVSPWESEGQGWWENPCGRFLVGLV